MSTHQLEGREKWKRDRGREGGEGEEDRKPARLLVLSVFLLPVLSGFGGPGRWYLREHPSQFHRLILRKGMKEDKVV